MTRLSNGEWLQVLSAIPAPGVPIEVDIYEPDGVSMLDTLQNAYQVKWQDQLNDVGSGSFMLNAHDPKATTTNLQKGNIVKLKIGGVYRFAFVIEEPEYIPVSQAGKHDETWLVQGRGVLSLLDRVEVYPLGWPTPAGPGDVLYTGAAGTMLWALLVLASARATLPFTYDDWSTVDSLNNPWPDVEELKFHAGTNLLDVINQLTALGVMDVYMDVNLHLYAYVSRSRDFSSAVIFRAGRHIADDKLHNKKHYSAIKSRVLVEGGTDATTGTPVYVEVVSGLETDPGIGRREGYLSMTNSTDVPTLTRAGEATLAGTAADAEPIQLPVKHGFPGPSPGDYEPYYSYDNGDYVTLDVPGVYDMAKYRVLSLTIAQRTNGTDYTILLDLNSVYVEALLRIAKQLGGKVGGSGGTSGGGTAASLSGASTSGSTGGTSGVLLGSATPLVESGSGTAGTSALGSHQDHVHPAVAGNTPSSTVTGPDAFGASAAAGAATAYSRGDHDHGLPALSSSAATASAPGDAAAAGTGTSPARSDHKHGREAWGAAADIGAETSGASAAAGTSGKVADAGHVHSMPTVSSLGTATPLVESGSGAAGTATNASHEDHVHPASAGGGSLSVTDGTHTVSSVTEIDFTSGATVSSGGAGIADVAITGGSGPSDYVSGASGSGHIIIPGLAGSPDIAPGGVNDDEFSALSGWTTLGTLDTSNVTDLLSHWHAVKTATGGQALFGIYKACPTLPFTVTCKLADFLMSANYQACGLLLAEASPGKLFHCGPIFNTGYQPDYGYTKWTNNTSRSAAVDIAAPLLAGGPWMMGPLYIRFVVHASNNVDVLLSKTGILFTAIATGIDTGFTVGSVGLAVGSETNSVKAEAYFDWIRFS